MKTIRLNLIFACTLALVSGCATTYQPEKGMPIATATFNVTSDSTSTTGMFINLNTYATPECEGGRIKLDSKLFADPQESFKPIKITANKLFVFEVAYSESRFAQNRSCFVNANFTPKANRNYIINYRSIHESTVCGVEVFEKTLSGEKIPLEIEYPEYACQESLSGKLKNGQSGFLNWKFSVTN